jgi:hypothetical protein
MINILNTWANLVSSYTERQSMGIHHLALVFIFQEEAMFSGSCYIEHTIFIGYIRRIRFKITSLAVLTIKLFCPYPTQVDNLSV